jgi:peptide chain release factor 3
MPDRSDNAPALPPEIARRRTFAIISHPDAGKTTLTEKFLLYGGAIQMAGQVRAKGEARRTRSDFMKMEKDRGISVSASAMSFEFGKYRFNLVDTPGHSDFSEDTYRTLTAVDAAIMVIDGAKGVESQTRKLFEVCRLRDLPILTFCNKMDRESRDTFEIIDEIQENLAIDVTPASWPIGMGRDFIGCLRPDPRPAGTDGPRRPQPWRTVRRHRRASTIPSSPSTSPPPCLRQLREEVEMARELAAAARPQAFREGTLTPIWFGSAINSFGVKELMAGSPNTGRRRRPSPRPSPREVGAGEDKVAGFVFKVQANMDPKHRDRVAFVRLASGHFRRGMKLTHVRSKKPMAISNPVLFLAADRELAEEAWAGDIIGIPNHGQLRIGDALTEGEGLRFTGIPSFAPELLQILPRRRPDEGQAPRQGADAIRRGRGGQGVQARPSARASSWAWWARCNSRCWPAGSSCEYGLPVRFEPTQFTSARWVSGPKDKVEALRAANKRHMATDHDGDPVYLTRMQWDIDRVVRDHPERDAERDEGVDDIDPAAGARRAAGALRGARPGARGNRCDQSPAKRISTCRVTMSMISARGPAAWPRMASDFAAAPRRNHPKLTLSATKEMMI